MLGRGEASMAETLQASVGAEIGPSIRVAPLGPRGKHLTDVGSISREAFRTEGTPVRQDNFQEAALPLRRRAEPVQQVRRLEFASLPQL